MIASHAIQHAYELDSRLANFYNPQSFFHLQLDGVSNKVLFQDRIEKQLSILFEHCRSVSLFFIKFDPKKLR